MEMERNVTTEYEGQRRTLLLKIVTVILLLEVIFCYIYLWLSVPFAMLVLHASVFLLLSIMAHNAKLLDVFKFPESGDDESLNWYKTVNHIND